ncbi:hypothetical protein FACS189499_07790 [Clostridia bacterium]|nr:hypothetical protein FACS189499_07790 [Clostridia bacterium]
MENTTRRTTQRVISAFITLSFVITTLFSGTSPFTFKVSAADGGISTNPTIITASLGAVTLNSGYYELQGTFTNAGRLTVNGDVHLILQDGCNVTISSGINCGVGNSLTIYGNTGKLTANGDAYQAGIGGGSGQAGGNITINGGTVIATGSNTTESGAGIGGGRAGAGGNITINGGTVIATGSNTEVGGAGIGGGRAGAGGNITINGGTVTATGSVGNTFYNNAGSAGIGGSAGTSGAAGAGGNIIINGGTVTANGGNWAPGIGGGGGWASGAGGAGGSIIINGGTILAAKGSDGICDIGPGKGSSNGANGTVKITGGSVKSNAGISPQPTNGTENVFLTTLTVGGVGDGTPLIAAGYGSGGSITANYGVNDVVTRDGGKVYFYLPADTYATNSIAVATSGTDKYDNSAAIAVTTSGTGTLDNSSSHTLYTITLNVQKNGSTWNSHGRFLSVPGFTLQSKNSDTITAQTLVNSGSFGVYDGAANTGVTIAAGGSATVNYYDTAIGDYNVSGTGSVVYDSTQKSVSVTSKGNAGTATVYYTGTGGTTYATTATAPTNAGTYDVTANAAGGVWNNGVLYFAATGLNAGTLTITPKPIDIAAIPGVTAPAYGNTPVTNITETAQYTGTVSWNPNHATFGYGTVYTATITLTPKANYTLTGVAADFFTVAGTDTGLPHNGTANGADSDTVTAIFPATPQPSYSLSVSAGANGSVSGTSGGSYAENTTINITATADGGYHFKEWTATGVSITTTANPAVFNMPANEVTLTANFEADDPTVTSVTVSAPSIEVQVGMAQLFAATVHGANSPSQAVIWSVSGNSSTGTTIINGLLTVAGDEANSPLTVTATSTLNGTQYGTANVAVTLGAPMLLTAAAFDTGDYVFTGAAEGYGTQTAKTVTITNTGNQDTGALSVELTGTNAMNFTLSTTTFADIAKGGNATFTVTPNTGLSAGNYTATVSVVSITSGGTLASFGVSFTVNSAPAFTITFNPNGGTVSPASAQTGTDGKLASFPTPYISGSYSFGGWFTATSGGAVVNTATVFSTNTTIYARWIYTGGGGGYNPPVPNPGSSSSTDVGSSGGGTTYDSYKTITPKVTASTFSENANLVRATAEQSTFGSNVNAVVTEKDDILAMFRKLLGYSAIIFPFDLSIYDSATNAKVQPRYGYKVKFTLPLPKELQARHSEVKLYTIVDGVLVELKLDFSYISGVWCANFETSHFSPYAFVVSNKPVVIASEQPLGDTDNVDVEAD